MAVAVEFDREAYQAQVDAFFQESGVSIDFDTVNVSQVVALSAEISELEQAVDAGLTANPVGIIELDIAQYTRDLFSAEVYSGLISKVGSLVVDLSDPNIDQLKTAQRQAQASSEGAAAVEQYLRNAAVAAETLPKLRDQHQRRQASDHAKKRMPDAYVELGQALGVSMPTPTHNIQTLYGSMQAPVETYLGARSDLVPLAARKLLEPFSAASTIRDLEGPLSDTVDKLVAIRDYDNSRDPRGGEKDMPGRFRAVREASLALQTEIQRVPHLYIVQSGNGINIGYTHQTLRDLGRYIASSG